MRVYTFLPCILIGLTLCFNVQAKKTELFSYSKQKIEQQFEQLNRVKNFVKEKEGITFTQLQKQEPSLLKGLHLTGNTSGISDAILPEPPLGDPILFLGASSRLGRYFNSISYHRQ